MPEQNVKEFHVARAIVINHLGELLITRRSDTCSHVPDRGCFEFPGGKQDPGEASTDEGLIETAYRETLEETGIETVFDVTRGPIHTDVHRFIDKAGRLRKRVTPFFVAIALSEEITIQATEISYAEWRPSGLIPGLKMTEGSRTAHISLSQLTQFIPLERQY